VIYKNCIIYLLGFPGVGKRTIAGEIAKHPSFRRICNHTINNVVFPFVRLDGKTKMPDEIWERTDRVRKVALDVMVELGNRDFSYVFTNKLLEEDAEDLETFQMLETAAAKMNAIFLPVRLTCEKEENKRRIQNLDRDRMMKTINPQVIDDMDKAVTLKPKNKNTVTLDVTHISPEEAATKVLEELSRLTS